MAPIKRMKRAFSKSNKNGHLGRKKINKIEKVKAKHRFKANDHVNVKNEPKNSVSAQKKLEVTQENVSQPLDLLLSTFTESSQVPNNKADGFNELSSAFRCMPNTISNFRKNGGYFSDDSKEKKYQCEDEPEMDHCESSSVDMGSESQCCVVENDMNVVDNFLEHLNYDLSTAMVECLTSDPIKTKSSDLYWPNLHNLKVEIPAPEEVGGKDDSLETMCDSKKDYVKQGVIPVLIEHLDWNMLCLKSQIQNNIRKANKDQLDDSDSEELTALQKEIFSVINNYQDLFYSERNFYNGEEIRFVYCLHVVNHILKTRLRIIHHNEKLLKKTNEQVPDEFRDQGLVRPKVLILVPFKDCCLRIVEMISSILLDEDRGNVINKTRFKEEFSGSELIIPKKNPKPEDYEQLFKGNIYDNFKIGLSFTKKSLKLYSDFYSSDVIIASPLGLRTVMGAQGDRKRDFDFLASVELLILDQAELFLMQNWDHVLLIFEHLHIQPKESHGTDFSRIRSWVLNGWSKFYRQTLLFSSIVTPELNAIFNRHCHNYSGKVRVINPVDCGSISMVVVQLSHLFQRFKAESVINACEARFEFFTEKILLQYKDPSLNGVLIYVPSYFDYVRIRNYLKRQDYSFVQICEYSKDSRIARARDKFFHNDARFLLYSERFHFFRRIRLKGIRHIIFYQLPTFPHFYSELCNLIKVFDSNNQPTNDGCNSSVTVLYCKYDIHQLSAVVKTSRAMKLLSSDREVHMFSTG